MRALVVTAALALTAVTAHAAGPGEVLFPPAQFQPVQDPSAHGAMWWGVGTLGRQKTFCWDQFNVWTAARPVYFYVRVAATRRIVLRQWIGDNHVPPQPWPGSSEYSGCAFISLADERALLRTPRLFVVEVKTQRTAIAMRARLHGPRTN